MTASSRQTFAWQRGWVAPDGLLPLVIGAWLPEADRLDGTGVVTLEDVRGIPCLMLLGEPGSGKSHALWQEAEAIRGLGEEVVFVDLGEPHDARDLRELVFDDEVVRRWRADTGSLHLFLDALDEAKVQIRKVVSLLESSLDRLDLSRLVLRVTCRTAERPLGFEGWLLDAFPEDGLATLELAPLRRSEIAAAATAAGVNAESFLQDVVRAGAAPFAARPLRLKMLLRVYLARGAFPDGLTSLYTEALQQMAGENDEERRALRTLSDTAAFAVAARIAAATVLSGRDVIGDGAGAVSVAELSGGTELDRWVAQPTEVAVGDVAVVREVLNTELFTARAGGMGWAHRTFGEYLAAVWLAGDRVSDAQVDDLLLVDDGSGRRVIPALRNVAGWLLTQRPSFEGRLHAADAVVLAYGDPASVAPEMRRRLLPALLDAIGDQELARIDARSLWPRLAYDGIADDLQIVLTAESANDDARSAAADAVGELGLVDLAPTLVDIALSPRESVNLRGTVLRRLEQLGDAVRREELTPLTRAADVHDEIRGLALRLCWPAEMSADELFAVLTPESDGGTYGRFMRQDCAVYLNSAEDLLAGVRWVLTLPRQWHSTRDAALLGDLIVAKAWPLAVADRRIAEALADLIALVAQRFMPVFATARSLRQTEALESALSDPEAIEAILEVLVSRAATGELELDLLRRAAQRNLDGITDLRPLAERWAEAPEVEREAWALAIVALAHGPAADSLYELRESFPELYAHVAWRYAPIVIDSREAEALRQRWAAEEAALAFPEEVVLDPVQLDQQVVAELDAFASGDVDGYWRMQYWLTVDDDGMLAGPTDDFTTTAGWRRATTDVRAAIVDGALPYLRRMEPDHSQWLGIEQIYWPAWAGHCALRLVYDEQRRNFDAFAAADWERWAPIVVGWRGDNRDAFFCAAIERVRELAAGVARSAGATEFLQRPTTSGIEQARRRLGPLWDAAMDEVLYEHLVTPGSPPDQVGAAAGDLIAHQHGDAEAWAVSRLRDPSAWTKDERRVSLELVEALARHAPERLLTIMRELADSNPEVSRMMLERLAPDVGTEWSARLAPEQLGELFEWLSELLPPDAAPLRAGPVTPAMHATFWRSRILEQLAQAGTQLAVDVVASLAARFDQTGWMRIVWHKAQEERRRALWVPPEPATVVRMGGIDRTRYVPDAVALQRIVLDALDDIAREMRGAYPLAPTLWNTSPYRLPKSENEVSNELARWLRERIGGRRAIVNREVQVNASDAMGGDRTDVQIQAASSADQPALTVVIEVKGAWNPSLMSEMSDQLVDRYLKPDLTDQGIYLAFWFSGKGWDTPNATQAARRARAVRSDAAELQALLCEQAASLSRARSVAVRAVVIDGSLPPPRSR